MEKSTAYFLTALISNNAIEEAAEKLDISTARLQKIIETLKKNPSENIQLINELKLNISSEIIEQGIKTPELIAVNLIQEYGNLARYFCHLLSPEKMNMKEIKSAILNNHSLLQDFGNAFKRCDKDCEFKDFLRKLLESRNRTIKRVAAEVTGNFFRGTNDKTLFEALKVLLKVDDFKVKMETVNALGSIFEKTGNQQVIELLLRFLIYDVSTFHFDDILAFNIVVRNICRIGNNSRKYREFILKLVEKVLKEKSMFAQQAAAEILGYTFRGTGDLKAFELLMKYFADAGINETMIITLGDIFRGTGLEMRILEKMLNTLTTEKLKIILIRELFKESGSIVALEMLKTFVRPIFLSENETEADYLDDDFEIRGELAQALKEIFRGTDNGEVIDILKYIFEDIEEDFYNALEAAYAIYEVAPGSYPY